MRKAVWVIAVVLAGAFGGYLAAGYGNHARVGGWQESHLEHIEQQLSALKVQLRKFKETHRRYPSTEEGLGVLDNFAARMKVVMFRFPAVEREDDLYHFSALGYDRSRGFWHMNQERVREYRWEQGHLPRTITEMKEALGASDQALYSTEPESGVLETAERELAIGHDDTVFLIGSAGVLTPWQVPYVYENRTGATKAAFADSPVDDYLADRYSIKIDEGVYVWSVGAIQYAEESHELWLKSFMIRCGGAGLIGLALVLILWLMRGLGKAPLAMGLMISALAGAASTGVQRTMCYVMLPVFSRRDPAMISRRVELLDKYRAAGVISDETYDKSLESMGLKPDQQPATRPDEEE